MALTEVKKGLAQQEIANDMLVGLTNATDYSKTVVKTTLNQQ